MPITPLSDGKITISYAIDLLRAHQIRRENVFLHEQLKSCVKELATVRGELRDLKANRLVAVENELKPLRTSIDDNATNASFLIERHETQLNDQACEIQALRQSCKEIGTETSNIKASCREIEENQQTQMAMVEKEFVAVRTACENGATAQQHTKDSLEKLQNALDGKADTTAVQLLEDRINKLSTAQNAGAASVDSVSRVSDTAEHDSVQVQDSQRRNHGPQEPLDRLVPPHPRETTVPDDLDLDANAHTISYAGHQGCVPEQNDSFRMLSPSTVKATQLAEIKTLQQRRFDGWDEYYNQGQKLVEALPHNFEGAIVRNFVDGLYKDTHKKQCQQWLDSSGWTWANVTVFGDLCSQLLADNAPKEAVETGRPRQIGVVLAAVSKSGQDGGGVKSKKRSKGKVQRVTANAPLRRSQRVAQKQNPNPSDTEEAKGKLDLVAHSMEQDMAQDPKPKTKPSTGQRQSSPTTEPQGRMRESDKAGAETQEATISAENRTSHKRTAAAINGHSVKRLKSRLNARGDGNVSIPQLVSVRKQSPEESSNEEGFLYDHWRASTKARQRTRKRLPLPPPPEIPILPTTDEEVTDQ